MASNVAFEILYREYYVRVFGLCRRLLNSTTLAEDATQEVFMRAFSHFDRFDSDQPFWQWIAAIAGNYCVDLLRRKKRGQRLFGDEEAELTLLESPEPPVLTSLVRAQEADELNGLIEQLPDKYRIPLVLAYFNESSYEQIAQDLGISRNHVGVLLLRAKQQLRTLLASSGKEAFEA